MVVEQFKEGSTEEIYRRAATKGRMLPEGLERIDSWVSLDLDRCYQVMECEDESLFQEWLAHWEDLVTFEIVQVVTSEQAQEKILKKL